MSYLWALVEECKPTGPTPEQWAAIREQAAREHAWCEAEAEDWLRHAVARLSDPSRGNWRAAHQATKERVAQVNATINRQREENRAVEQEELAL